MGAAARATRAQHTQQHFGSPPIVPAAAAAAAAAAVGVVPMHMRVEHPRDLALGSDSFHTAAAAA
eukprot:607774-Pelagomonas_calceolata.AAC.1